MTQTETRIFHYDLRDHLIAETNQTEQTIAEYIYLGDQLLSMIKPGESVYYYHNDHLGTPQVLTDDSQAIAWKAVYTPFGEAVASVQTIENPFRFPGQYYDQETGLHYNYFRYYNPQTGRYITPDPIGLEGGINLFVYVANNPVNESDPSGLLGPFGPGFKMVKWPSYQNPYLPGPDTEMEAPFWMERMRGYPRGKAIPGQWGTSGLIPLAVGLVAGFEIVEPPVTNVIEVIYHRGPVVLVPFTKEQIEEIIDRMISPRNAGAVEKGKNRGCGR